VARRQRALEDGGAVRGCAADIDLSEFDLAVKPSDSVLRCRLMSGRDDYLLILLVRDLVAFERIHKTQLSRLPHVARIQSSLALRDVVRRARPVDLLRD
jgi:DNA-binding Lrp family transcriptional regulator